ncbi:MAG: helix-turn-helix domain-containing protein [bacterium]
MPLRHWEIAQLLAVTPAYLSRLFNRLEQEGILLRRKGWLTISDPDNLWHNSDL